MVPANADDWSQPPFAGEIVDGCLWGRGAVDMKDFDAMVLSVVRARARAGAAPRRPFRLVFTADEEAGGEQGALWLVEHHPEVLEGCTEAIGEVGGFSITVSDDLRLYLIQTAEKGIAWLRLIADGQAGHGSFRNPDNAITELSAAVARIGNYEWPHRITDRAAAFLEAVSEALEIDFDPDRAEETLAKLGSIARMVGATMSNTANPTMLQAGYKHNVIPARATAAVDGRIVPGGEDEFFATITELLGDRVRYEVLAAPPVGGDRVRRRPGRGHADQPGRRGSRRPHRPVPDERGHRREGLEPAGDPLLRVRPAATAARSGLRQPLPRRRRAGPDGVAGVRRPGPRPLPGHRVVEATPAVRRPARG